MTQTRTQTQEKAIQILKKLYAPRRESEEQPEISVGKAGGGIFVVTQQTTLCLEEVDLVPGYAVYMFGIHQTDPSKLHISYRKRLQSEEDVTA